MMEQKKARSPFVRGRTYFIIPNKLYRRTSYWMIRTGTGTQCAVESAYFVLVVLFFVKTQEPHFDKSFF
jgi:hypothetical protein